MDPPRRGLVALVVAPLTLLATACGTAPAVDDAGAADVAAPTTVSPTSVTPTAEATITTPPTTTPPTTGAPAPPSTTTTVAPTTTTTTAPPDPSLRRGSEGPEVVALQEHLVALGHHVPAVDGRYGSLTAQAVMAFQKAAGIGRDGIAGPQTLAALETATWIGPREGGDHIEIDLERQLMFLVRGDRTWIFNTSTGTTGWRTPPGRFTITRQIDGVRVAELGELYRPKYFNGGIALHGSPSIPGHPASHGCARLHDDIVDMIWAEDLAPVGTPVWVY